MANTLRFKRGLASGIPTALAGEPLFTTDTFDLYIGNGTTNTRFQKYIASGATTQILRGDGSLYTFPLAISSPLAGQVLKYNGTSWVNDSDSGITGSGAAGQVAYFTGATTQAGSNNLFWDSTNARLGVGTNSPLHLVDVAAAGNSALYIRAGATSLSRLIFGTSTNNNRGFVDYDNSTNSLIVRANENESFRVFGSTRNVGINTGATDSGQKLQVVGTGYFSGTLRVDGNISMGIAPSADSNIYIRKALSGSVFPAGIYMDSQISATSTSGAVYVNTVASTENTTFTLPNLYHFRLQQGTFGASSTVTNQYGFFVDSSLVAATNNYGFYGNIAASTGRWNLYMNGTANNYMAGSLGIGTTTMTAKFNVDSGATAEYARFNSTNASGGYARFNNSGTTIGFIGAGTQITVGGAVNDFAISTLNNIVFAAGTGYAERMRLTTLGNLHIGTFSADSGEKLQVTGTMKVTGASSFGGNMTLSLNQNAGTIFTISNTISGAAAYSQLYLQSNTTSGSGRIAKNSTLITAYKIFGANDLSIYNDTAGDIGILNDFATGNIKFAAGASSSTQMILNASGNLGLAITPSAWQTTSNVKAIQFGGGSIISYNNDRIFIGQNTFFNTSGNDTYINTAAASLYRQFSGSHTWFNAPSGTAGNAITFTQAMTLDASGNLLLGTTSSSSVNGSGIFPKAIFYNTTGDNIIAKNATQEVAIGGDYIFANTNNALRFGANNGEGARLTPSRNLHIGTFSSDSGEKLQVTGTAKFTSDISLISSANAVLTIDALSTNTAAFIFKRSGTEAGRIAFSNSANMIFHTGSAATQRMVIDGSTGAVSVVNNFAVDTNTLFVDATNNRVGIGTASPSHKLSISQTTDNLYGASITTSVTTGTSYGLRIQAGTNSSDTALAVFSQAGSNYLTVRGDGNIGIGSALVGATGTSTLSIGSGTAPSSNVTDSFQLYSADITAGNAAPHFRTENGAVIKLYQETTAVGNSTISLGGGSAVLDDTEFDGYTLRQLVRALRNQGILQ